MAMRYSGDARITLAYRPGFILGGVVSAKIADGLATFAAEYPVRRRPTSEDYDRIARRLVADAMRKTRGRLRADPKDIRRGHHAPCSV